MSIKLLNFVSHLRHAYRCSSTCKARSNRMLNSLTSKINLLGPITVHDYMREALTDPKYGYYMNKDVFGKSGDFITSPEISQLFGEMIAVWLLNEWNKLGSPKPLQLIELGPGRGTMMQDILRVYNQLGFSPSDLSIHFVEVSQKLSRIQARNLCQIMSSNPPADQNSYQTGVTSAGSTVHWHSTINQVPEAFSCILAHEFFDALPIHILKKTEGGWNEVLIDIDKTGEQLRYVLSNNSTPACIYSKYANGREYFEISPQSGVIMEEISRRLEEFGGFALVIDYGHDGTKTDTFRGFREHKIVDPLIQPGQCDLTADVDFSFLKTVSAKKLVSFGPVPQYHFLKQLHIDVRLKMLLNNCKSEEKKTEIQSGYHMIMDADKMGTCFQVASFFPAVLDDYLKRYPVAGFVK